MQRKIEFAIGEYYHIYSRGIEKRKIFEDSNDYLRFLVLLYLCNSSQEVHLGDHIQRGFPLEDLFNEQLPDNLVSIGAYCLMPNHFHLLIREKIEGGISTFMKKLLTGYSMYFNKKNERTGPLFEGRFKAIHVGEDRYLEYLFSYIHLNPIKLIDHDWRGNKNFDHKEARNFLDTYFYSSYSFYSGHHHQENKILDNQSFPEYFQEEKDFKSFIDSWLNFSEEEAGIYRQD
ncbi:MAG: transposase [Candidatus Vogelbacteria bacterium]|nr:transposase [Candidatus Vogelbacteria bacterium]